MGGASGNLRSSNMTVAELAAAAAAGCTMADATAMASLGGGNSDGTFPRTLADCGKQNYRLFSGFNSCVQEAAGISSTCASCFATAAQYGADNCKWSCFWGSWCGSDCLKCEEPENEATQRCAGVDVPKASSC